MLKICLTGWMNSSVSVYKAHVQVICQLSVCSRFFGILDHVSMPFRTRPQCSRTENVQMRRSFNKYSS